MSEHELWNTRRGKLQKAVVDATLALFEHTDSQSFKLPLDGNGILFVVSGDAAGIASLASTSPAQPQVSEEMIAALVEAAKTHLLWIDRERQGPLYPAGVHRDHPEGEAIWRAWWEDQLRLCSLTEEQCRAAVARVRNQDRQVER